MRRRSIPRNASHVSRLRSKKASFSSSKPSDPLQALVVKFKEQFGSPNQYIQTIQLVPDPIIVLFNKNQLDEMEQFCTQVIMVKQVYLVWMSPLIWDHSM